MERKLNWLIYTLPYDKKIGGSVVMHHLAKSLLKFGDKVVTTGNSPFEGIRLADENIVNKIDARDWVVVFAETDSNPEKYPNVLRWILYTLGGFKGYKGVYNDKELVVQYGKSFTIGTQYETVQQLTNIVFEFDFWKDLKYERSDEDLTLLKKGKYFFEDINLEGRKLDDENFDDNILLDAFNRHKRFVTYDNDTFHSVQAAVCGAISIVIPDGRLSEKEWRNGSRNRRWGIAYGDTPEQIKYALETRELLINDLKLQVEDGEKQIEEVRKNVLKKFPGFYKITCIIETEWKSLFLIDQLKNYKSDMNVGQIIIIDRDKKNRPTWVDLTGIDLIEFDGDKIPAIELGIENSIYDYIMVASDKLKFNTNFVTNKTIENKEALGVFFIHPNNFLYKRLNKGFMGLKDFSESDVESYERLYIFSKSQYIKTPPLKNDGISVWINKTFKNKYFLLVDELIEGFNNPYKQEYDKNHDDLIIKKIIE